jgi:hypothetical protein
VRSLAQVQLGLGRTQQILMLIRSLYCGLDIRDEMEPHYCANEEDAPRRATPLESRTVGDARRRDPRRQRNLDAALEFFAVKVYRFRSESRIERAGFVWTLTSRRLRAEVIASHGA